MPGIQEVKTPAADGFNEFPFDSNDFNEFPFDSTTFAVGRSRVWWQELSVRLYLTWAEYVEEWRLRPEAGCIPELIRAL